jgi:hypothetical protein
MELLVSFLRNEADVAEGDIAMQTEETYSATTCLICLDQFTNVDSLTNHCMRRHVDKGTFSMPFPCPECRRKEKDEHRIADASAWAAHVEITHANSCKRLDFCWPQWVHFGSQEHHRTSWNPMESHGTSWNPTEPHEISWNLMESHRTSWKVLEHGRIFWLLTNDYQ